MKNPGYAVLLWHVTMVVLVATAFAESKRPDGTRPNIVFIYADDMGYGDVSSYFPNHLQTPNLDRMAENGVRFTEYYSASPVCTPSRAALLTGRYPIRQGIHHVFFPESYGRLAPEETTIAEVLKASGYTTGMVGMWHLGHREKYLPLQQGFDEFFGVPFSNDMGGFYYIRGNTVV